MGFPIVMPPARPQPALQSESLDCAAFELMLAEVLERDQLPAPAQSHLRSCAACASVLATFEDIAARVRRLPPEESEPPVNLWPHIAARLREEGIIHADLESCRAAAPAPRLVPGNSKLHPGA